ncbi:MAG TPA: cytochrome P450 [Mycobacteriales bacterium]|nr:cytochrome P450 [Mycobacteriales bacterium]
MPTLDDEVMAFDPEEFLAVQGDVRDPYPDLAAERVANPVKKVNLAEEFGIVPDPNLPPPPDMYTAFSYDAVRTVLSDDSSFSSSGYKDVMGFLMGHTILEMDAPEHPPHRRLVASAFRPRMMENWKQTVIQKTVDELLDRVVAKGSCDLVRSLTFPFPVRVIARLLGLPPEDWATFQKLSIELIGVSVNFERAIKASQELHAYFTNVITEKRVTPGDDLISQLIDAEVEGQKLDDEAIIAFLRLLLPAGAETTYRSSGNLLYLLLTHPEVLEEVRENRDLLPQTIEEALRLEPPLLFVMRTAIRDVEVAGVTIPGGAQVGVSMGAANRDPSRWDDPDVFDIHRPPVQHISFAAGPHLCLGTHLARMETTVAIERVLDRLPNLRLDPSVEDVHIHGLTFRSPTSLPVLFDPS